MNRVRFLPKIALAASAALAMAFTFGCSDDKEPDYKWCAVSYVAIPNTVTCFEIGKDYAGATFKKEHCDAYNISGVSTGKASESKPSECPSTDE